MMTSYNPTTSYTHSDSEDPSMQHNVSPNIEILHSVEPIIARGREGNAMTAD